MKLHTTRAFRFLICLLLAYALVVLSLPTLPSALAKRETGTRPNGSEFFRAPAQQSAAPRRNGELLVRFRGGMSEQDKANAAASQGARRSRNLRGESGIEKLELNPAQNPEAAAQQLRLNPAVEFAEPNFLIQHDELRLEATSRGKFKGPAQPLFEANVYDPASPLIAPSAPELMPQSQGIQPNDPRFPEEWALSNNGQSGGQFGSDIGVTAAWQTTAGARSTVIAVIDSGIDFTHPDLLNNQWSNPWAGPDRDLHGWDYVANSGTIIDEQGHGTAIAGIIAAEGNNAIGVSGVMWHASLMSLRVLDNTGTGDVADAVEAIDYAVAHGAYVINISWGTSGESLAVKDAIERALLRGVAVVCSAGNSGQNVEQTPYYPASFNIRDLISVAATDNFDQLSSWSNWGRSRVSVAAPGTNILTTQRGGGYWLTTGTSAAAPLVSGVAGLLKSARPGAHSQQVARAIERGARQVASLQSKVSSGGVVSATGALRELHGPSNPPQLPPPGYGTGGTGLGGTFNTAPPPVTPTAPGANLPNLDQVRNATQQPTQARQPIQSNLVCADCDPLDGGGGGSYYPAGDPDFSVARERPEDEIGTTPGVDLGSRNFNWSLPLLNLPGRAGMDLGLTLYYNSLVWTRDGSYIKFNADKGNPAPGFRLGLPKLQHRFYNNQTGAYSYMLITSSGSRMELRQIGSSHVYESIDGSYTQLDDTTATAPFVRTSDGSRLQFAPVTINSEFRCTEMKDRNGNKITATYTTSNGHLQTIMDTLGREITFVYDGTSNLTAIRQTWAGTAHDWATFEYGEAWIAPGFSGLYINGANNNNVTVLNRVNLPDGSSYRFQYNTNFGQVNRINHYAADNHLLSYTSYNMSSGSGQTDCPRFTERRDWAENWNGDGNGVPATAEEAVTSYSVATDNSWTKVTAPDGTIYKEFFNTTPDWKKGLTSETKNFVNAAAETAGTWKKRTTIDWTQTDVNLSYQKNPRVIETNIYDSDGNRKRTTIFYGPYEQYSLPYLVRDYAADGVTEIRHSYTDYNLSQAYLDRRIIGLVSAIHVSNTAQWQTKVTYTYDEPSKLEALPAAATNHDTSYNTSFLTRGNVTAVSRWDVNDINNPAKALTTQVSYNTTGGVIRSTDPAGHQSNIAYGDSFSDGNNSRNTFAYPTTVTDGDNFQAFSEAEFETGAPTKTLTPAKGTGGGDPIYYLDYRTTYDSAGRIAQVTNQGNGAYTRYVYSPYGEIATFSTIQNGAGEAFSVTYFDGAGRLRSIGSDNPNSSGGYRGQFSLYDNMGRLWWQSNPAEMTGSWVPTADDAAGWVWTTQAYDWKGRPTVTTLPDGATRENTYGGCGCAGGEVTT
ncbi:MAG TPA: S8 family serine peptidase, partial [Pyrinomonadaceae bacterium]|nr:S8 family serine peptidase [Pyrinomonadaceae bacterium]